MGNCFVYLNFLSLFISSLEAVIISPVIYNVIVTLYKYALTILTAIMQTTECCTRINRKYVCVNTVYKQLIMFDFFYEMININCR